MQIERGSKGAFLRFALCQNPSVVKRQRSAKTILAALKIETAQPHMTASALAGLCSAAERRKSVLHQRSFQSHALRRVRPAPH